MRHVRGVGAFPSASYDPIQKCTEVTIMKVFGKISRAENHSRKKGILSEFEQTEEIHIYERYEEQV